MLVLVEVVLLIVFEGFLWEPVHFSGSLPEWCGKYDAMDSYQAIYVLGGPKI